MRAWMGIKGGIQTLIYVLETIQIPSSVKKPYILSKYQLLSHKLGKNINKPQTPDPV